MVFIGFLIMTLGFYCLYVTYLGFVALLEFVSLLPFLCLPPPPPPLNVCDSSYINSRNFILCLYLGHTSPICLPVLQSTGLFST